MYQEVKVVIQDDIRKDFHAAKLAHSAELIAPHPLALIADPKAAAGNPRNTVVNALVNL
jgi:hypothetical protein